MAEVTGKMLRCAVYTRKSSEEGLEQAFNSLHAQREACEAFIKSQQHEGWVLDPTPYDDGAFSGGNMQRPALQAILAEVKAGRVDVIVVYKVDRLTRSLADFARIVDVLDTAKASFVSVTQAFNTTTSMGRLTLNVLLSFAQFEREVTGERIRDKIAASKKKGMWMGGVPPLGYDAANRKLVINKGEAETVRTLFEMFIACRSVDKLLPKAEALGLRTKSRLTVKGPSGGHSFSRGTLYHLLENRTYLGEGVHRGASYSGDHDAIIDREVFDAAQAVIAANRRTRKMGANSPHPSLLAGLFVDHQGHRFTPTHTQKGGKRYRYYAMAAHGSEPAYRLPAIEIEPIVQEAILAFLSAPGRVIAALGAMGAAAASVALAKSAELAGQWTVSCDQSRRQAANDLLDGVVYRPEGLDPRLRLSAFGDYADQISTLHLPTQIARRGVTLKLVVDNAGPRDDARLLSFIATGEAWFQDLADGKVATIAALAEREGCTRAYVRRVINAGFLSPKLKAAIRDGNHPVDLTIAALAQAGPLPLDWNDHHTAIKNGAAR